MNALESNSSRYALIDTYDRFSRHRVFVDVARSYRSVLEFGCSNGFLSRLIAEGGAKVVGVEIDEEAAAEARRFCSKVHVLDLNRSDWAGDIGERFDLATFGDVLEHLFDPVSALRESKKVLNPGGRVLVCLPNVAHWTIRAKLALGNFDYQAIGILDHTHLRFFTATSARRLIEESGFKVLQFRPLIGGRYTDRSRAGWDWLARVWPGAFAYQMLFLVEPG